MNMGQQCTSAALRANTILLFISSCTTSRLMLGTYEATVISNPVLCHHHARNVTDELQRVQQKATKVVGLYDISRQAKIKEPVQTKEWLRVGDILNSCLPVPEDGLYKRQLRLFSELHSGGRAAQVTRCSTRNSNWMQRKKKFFTMKVG